MSFKLTRQRDAKDNRLFVEIACGGPKSSGPDVLTDRYVLLGEGKNLINPKDAVNIAERVHKKWHMDYPDENKALRIVGIENPLEFSFTKQGIADAHKWADKVVSEMSKCGNCDRVMGSRAPFTVDDIANRVFCSEVCIATKYRQMFGVELPSVKAAKKDKKKLPF